MKKTNLMSFAGSGDRHNPEDQLHANYQVYAYNCFLEF